ncbi:acetyltransferase [Desulfuribacillus alkaliarsenatis]|uniref:PglD N-terminal domain-containing protein n=1 Tax=Desulfuribacillus alkaliarsenatis TaxID=766136 RepID=A0A1E5G1N0_9FIRM|nr:acetyltransferase [Desulfuribacillus alkaliarsenatis]OEF96817.1 hypothetical protein BHF68_07080 [Desulfuribacillus alkaliarsenatis]
MANLLILGAGGHGKVVAEVAQSMNKWKDIAFLDDDKDLKHVLGYKVIGEINQYDKYYKHYSHAFVAIGNNKLRLELINELIKKGYTVPTLIHSFTSISATSQIGLGTIVMPGAVINADVKIGNGCIINTSSSVDHDCIIEDGVHISPGVHLGGSVYIGNGSWVCIGANVANNIEIGENVKVAAGAVVINNFKDNVLIGGVPAKIIKTL